MFTGIVEGLGEVVGVENERLVVLCEISGIDVGDSLAVKGVCLTVVDKTGGELAFDLSPETVTRTSLGSVVPGDALNLERPVSLAARLGGHLVQGHVDGVGEIVTVAADASGSAVVGISLPAEVVRYVVEKGSIAIDGVSLTVVRLRGDVAEIALVPYTRAVTTLGSIEPGDVVNVEVDMIAKYVERLVGGRQR